MQAYRQSRINFHTSQPHLTSVAAPTDLRCDVTRFVPETLWPAPRVQLGMPDGSCDPRKCTMWLVQQPLMVILDGVIRYVACHVRNLDCLDAARRVHNNSATSCIRLRSHLLLETSCQKRRSCTAFLVSPGMFAVILSPLAQRHQSCLHFSGPGLGLSQLLQSFAWAVLA